MKVTRHVQSTEKRSLLNFSNILRKSIATDFFACWYKFRKANGNLVIIGQEWVAIKFRLYGTLKSGASHI